MFLAITRRHANELDIMNTLNGALNLSECYGYRRCIAAVLRRESDQELYFGIKCPFNLKVSSSSRKSRRAYSPMVTSFI